MLARLHVARRDKVVAAVGAVSDLEDVVAAEEVVEDVGRLGARIESQCCNLRRGLLNHHMLLL